MNVRGGIRRGTAGFSRGFRDEFAAQAGESAAS